MRNAAAIAIRSPRATRPAVCLRCVRSLRYSNDLHSKGTDFEFSAICDDNFHRVVTQFDGTTRRIFWDGVLKSSDDPSGTHASQNNNFCLGGEVARNSYGFIGQIRNVRIFTSGSVDPTGTCITL